MHLHDLARKPHPVDLLAVIKTFKALSDPIRLRIVLLLVHGEQPVCDLVTSLELPQSTVSRHLALLRAAELVETRRAGSHVHYRIANAHLGDLVLQAFSHAEHERLGLPDHESRTGLPAASHRPPAESC